MTKFRDAFLEGVATGLGFVVCVCLIMLVLSWFGMAEVSIWFGSGDINYD